MSRRSTLQTFKNWAVYRALRIFAAMARRLPLSLGRGAGSSLGLLAHAVVRRERAKALRNIAVAFPEKTDRERRRIIRDTFIHLGRSLFEICWLPNLNAPRMSRSTTFEGLENMKAAVAEKRGVVLFTGHCGNWEWMAAAIALSGFDMNVIARELYDPRINDFVVKSRAQFGVRSIGRGSSASAREILQTLKGGSILGVLIDQNIKAEGAEVPFFGKPAFTPTGPAKLAIRAGAVAIAGFIERQGDRQIVRFESPVITSRSDDAVALTTQMTSAIENHIRRVPSQWVWMHDRWKNRSRK
ncbi:MAG TPA: lysophospholipid acyltransferase family protein [Thermoanaerobaculia bacterium]|nr:lysophospholipid acyltransferase family protein [Thermoanaerobaculia bacterium]